MTTSLFQNALLFDGVHPDLSPCDVLVADGVIREIASRIRPSGDVTQIDLRGRTLMPGLIDAHVHAYFPDANPAVTDRMPMTLVAHHARRMLEDSLTRGFTTVRDCGGGDYGLYLAIERGWVKGPRLFYCGKSLSQTGGHGDKRAPFEESLCACGHAPEIGYVGHRTRVVDGVENLRLAVREEMHHGASFIKLMASGGVSSSGDPIRLPQYAEDEIRAVVEEVERHDAYVTAHVHPDEALRRCIELGVHCIEHGTLITDATAALATEKNVAVVPTLAVIKALSDFGADLGFPAALLRKLEEIEPAALGSLERLKRAGTITGFGTDLIGPLDHHQCLEFTLRRDVLSPFDILRSATSVNAQILRQGHRLGRVAEGYIADLIVVDGDPLRDVSVFQSDGRHVPVVMKGGVMMKHID